MARSVGDVLVVQLGRLSLELANATARAETAEELLSAARKELSQYRPEPAPKVETKSETKGGT